MLNVLKVILEGLRLCINDNYLLLTNIPIILLDKCSFYDHIKNCLKGLQEGFLPSVSILIESILVYYQQQLEYLFTSAIQCHGNSSFT